MRAVATVLLSLLLLPAEAQQTPQDVSDTVGRGEFPGLQLLPPGSVVKGISLPRYENHRVTALVQIRELRVESRTRITLEGIAATLFSKDGFRTAVSTPRATYDFSTMRAETSGRTTVRDGRFTARGGRVLRILNIIICCLSSRNHRLFHYIKFLTLYPLNILKYYFVTAIMSEATLTSIPNTVEPTESHV